MKKILKRAIFLMMTVGLFVSICGCGNLKSPVQQEKENEEKCQLTLELLKEKYEEDFEILSYFYDGGFNALCYPVNHPEMIFDAYVPNGRISEDTYAEEILIRTLQQKCNEVLDELGIEYYCRPVIFYYEKYMGSGKFDKEGSKEYIEEYYSIDLVKDIRESEVMIEVYIVMDEEYDSEKLYYTVYDLLSVMSINDGSVGYNFITKSEMDYLRQYYDKASLNMGSSPVDTFYDSSVGIIDFNVINTKYEDFKSRFDEYQSRARAEKNDLFR